MDDWQEPALSSRHFHNRVGREDRGSVSRNKGRNGPFDVKSSFGTYELKYPALDKFTNTPSKKNKQTRSSPSMELFRLTDDGNGILGQLMLPDMIEVTIVLAGSRKVLLKTAEDLEDHAKSEGSGKRGSEQDDCEGEGPKVDSDEPISDGESPDEEVQSNDSSAEESRGKSGSNRFHTFEKNSFRAPKFWIQWRGKVKRPGSPIEETNGNLIDTGMGYIVFSGNNCRKFKGTISCEALGWKDTSITGWKTVSRSERDKPVTWVPLKE
ncbi:uncharacterized protein BCR38DRAFT_429496 [Pseudomassariella vexata]|uniref:Uncharacterized protein n=1 Tax=Pseudomassariella vexata TaxID=1141098 RepID=A0A1Y2E404_9PEZI|nr:uncharacterized protein BCR38DRAFT_429496 [Pseudomassariella vexata]ORY66177.1 hypothetical protein BCR38DRAFT_429496 [Pseudomassariella vexata]